MTTDVVDAAGVTRSIQTLSDLTKDAGATGAAVLRVIAASDAPDVASLAIMDDWDESDRAKVNPVVGQAGIAAGTGVDAANALRVSLATDIGLPAGTALIGKVGVDQTTPGTTNAVAIISGQAGIAGGTGADGATVPRVTLATDVGLPAGTALIGKVGIDQTTPGTTNAVVNTNAAGTALIGKVSAGLDSSNVYNGAAALTPKFAAISASGSGANAVVTAVADKKIRVLAMHLSAAGTVNAKWQSASTDKTGLSYLTVGLQVVLGYNPNGWFETAVSEALNINLSDAIAVGGMLVYVEV